MSSSTTSTQIRLARRPVGEPADDDFTIDTVDVPALGEGDVLLRTIYLSLDPYMRGRMSDAKSYAAPVELGDVMVGSTVCEVVESRSETRPVGTYVLAFTGWQSHAVVPARQTRRLDPATAPISTALGVLGMPGFTAYAGLLQIGKPQEGETVVVAAAAGPVGSAVGQIARAKGARAVGIAGGAEKVKILRDVYGFDEALDHRAPDFVEQLKAATPDGVDVYFENVAGTVGEAVVRRMNTYGRIPVCGLVADYNATEPREGAEPGPALLRRVLTKSLTIRGFIQDEFVAEHHADFLREMGGWVGAGTVQYREDVVEGLENAVDAFRGLLTGRNVGKLLVQVGEDPSRA
ncbi:NADP-dependent oxidoreductase [Aeromicrobium sp. Leaf350]|uniref:NADP-dependent oxidoreductase n=1 Tax=Aeromicrobium sp. Leaf350 TaxID=2876565 RepID=UPI001E35762D|nr:NADP-dependent oxidoreductase [Aeromicrobium sp. Leaf350]